MLQDVWVAIDEGRYADAEAILDADSALRASAPGRMALGYILAFTGRLGEAREVYAGLRNEARELGNDLAEHVALHQLGMVERMGGNLDTALAVFEEERSLIKPEDEHAASVNAYELGYVNLLRGNLDEARVWLTACRELSERGDDPIALGCAWRGLGELAARQGNSDEAREAYVRAKTAFLDGEDEDGVRSVEALERV